MRTTVYPNTKNFVMSDRNKSSLSAVDHETLQLSDAERIKITQLFLCQIPLCCLTQRAAKIVTAIFSQTIDFNKFEDDMNGRRLQQLTKLFPHHANEVVRTLEATHVLISRKGHYGKYLSINFNFSQWGKEVCDSGEVITNDPTIILDKERFMASNPPEATEKSRTNPANQAFEAASPLSPQDIAHTTTQPDYSQDLLKDLLIAIGRIEGNVNDLSEKQSNAEKTAHLQQANVEKTVERLLTADIEKMILRVLKKTTDQQQANIEKTVERLLTADIEKMILRVLKTYIQHLI